MTDKELIAFNKRLLKVQAEVEKRVSAQKFKQPMAGLRSYLWRNWIRENCFEDLR